jgi:hypothetical protein
MKEHLKRKEEKKAKRSKYTFIHLRFDFGTYKL